MTNTSQYQPSLVSIIIPAYNAEASIQRCLDSIVNQTYKALEIIVVNDGSTDHTLDILNQYVQLDARMIIKDIPNGGVSHARNVGLDTATGQYVQFVDSDDWLSLDATEQLVQAISYNCQQAISDYTRVLEKRELVRGDIKTQGMMSRANFALEMMRAPANFYYGVLWNKMYSMQRIKENHLQFDEDINWCEDFLFNLEYLQYVKQVYVLHRPLYFYVKTKGGLSSVGCDLKEIVTMKTTLFKHYKALYESIDLYDENKLKIKRFYIDFARDTIKSYKKNKKIQAVS